MATPVASTNVLFQPPAAARAPATNTNQARAAGTSSFETVLASTTRTAQTAAPDDIRATNEVVNDINDRDTERDSAAADASLAGLLALATQVLAPPVNAAVAQATGQTEPPAPALADVAARTRGDQLQLDRGSDALRTEVPAVAAQNPAPVPATPEPAEPVAPVEIVEPAAPTVPTAATFASRPGGSSSIPAQGQIVANVVPNVPVPVNMSVTTPPVNEPSAPIAATALPSAQLGERPATAGEQFVADTEAGARLVAGESSTGKFASTLAHAIPEDFVGPGTAGTAVLPIAVSPAEGALAVASAVLPSGSARDDDPRSDAAALVGAGPQFAPSVSAPSPNEAAAHPTPAAQVADTIVTHAHVLERDGRVEFQMRLDPPELGQLQIRLVARGSEIHGHVLVASEAVRGLIESQLPELRQRLEAAGVNVQQFDVSTDPSAGGNQNPYREAVPQEYLPRVPAAPILAPRVRIGRHDAGALDVTV